MRNTSRPVIEHELVWFKATASSEEGACVEAACLRDAMAVRDSKVVGSPVQVFSSFAWGEFVRGIGRG